MSLLDEIKKDVEGVQVIRDWLGDDGIPVAYPHAQSRADICTRCPQNYKPRWWDLVGYAKDRIANAIRYQIEIKQRLDMNLPNEEEIGTCRICGCNLPLKVWTPIQYLKDHLTPDKLEQYPAYCWQRNEMERLLHL